MGSVGWVPGVPLGTGLVAFFALRKKPLTPSPMALPGTLFLSKERYLFLFYFGGLPLYTFN